MKKQLLSILAGCSLGIALITLFICIMGTQTAQASSAYIVNFGVNNSCRVGGATFSSHTYQSSDIYSAKIVMKKNGKKSTIAKNTDASFVTNGKVLYYSKHEKLLDQELYQFENTIYRYNISSGKHTKIITGLDYTVRNCSGTYLYYGTDNGPDGVDLYALNIKTTKKKYMTDGVGRVRVSGKRVITSTNTGDAANLPIYSFKLDGSGKKKIADGGLLNVRNGKVYYFVCNEKIPGTYKAYKCTTKGKNKKALTGWVANIPTKYMDW